MQLDDAIGNVKVAINSLLKGKQSLQDIRSEFNSIFSGLEAFRSPERQLVLGWELNSVIYQLNKEIELLKSTGEHSIVDQDQVVEESCGTCISDLAALRRHASLVLQQLAKDYQKTYE
jgi:hypothetical protein